jgi:hypothetical protein
VSSWTWETSIEKKHNYEEFVRFLHDQRPWESQEGIVFSWWSHSKKFFVLVLSDDNVVNMFDDNEYGKHIRILVQFCKKGKEHQLVNTLVEPIPPPSPFKKREHQHVVEELTQSSQQQDEYEEDHVGMDEEFTMYYDDEEEEDVDENEASQQVLSDVEEDSEEDSEEEEVHERSEEDDDEEEEITDEEDSEGAVPEDIPVVHYDKDNPSFTKGSLFPSIAEFKVALSTHAVKGEFNYKTIKSDTKRVRIKCASGKKCKWRVNGYVLADGYTVQVRNKPVKHRCQSKRRDGKVKAANRKWIAAHVIDWLKNDPTLTSIALQQKLFEKYHVQIHY